MEHKETFTRIEVQQVMGFSIFIGFLMGLVLGLLIP